MNDNQRTTAEQARTRRRWRMAGLLSLFVVVLVFFLLSIPFRQGFASVSWPVVPGEILESHLELTGGSDIRTRGDRYEWEVRYRYTVEGEVREGTRLRYGHERPTTDEAQTLAERYPEGRVVDVHHHPRRPGRAVLETGISLRALFLTILSGFFYTAVPLVAAVICFRMAR